ncbi:uncharacterized protein LOC120003549 [Tripterygium wilfordii]|uniref:uncharacterized protein LOC120003549 n=1 Tax=Tripterygium wilfordii TaxID=458696 RepID=UPI0018F81C67|nr:uncharacterized protein LOC120003549 [Tripterygium wilfordii]
MLCSEFDRVRVGCNFSSAFPVSSAGRKGGLALLWQQDISVTIKNFSRYHIDAVVENFGGGCPWRFTGVYGESVADLRFNFWKIMQTLSSVINLPWLCAGDFNEILFDFEKKGGPPRQTSLMQQFHDALEICNMVSMDSSGPPFTWSNGRSDPNNVRVRLDRAVANPEWRLLFPQCNVQVSTFAKSDHNPLVISLVQRTSVPVGRRKGKFKFEEYWTTHPDCKELIKEAWSQGNPHLPRKLQDLCSQLHDWSRTTFKLGDHKLAHLHKELLRTQVDVNNGDLVSKEWELKQEINNLMMQEEMKWSERHRRNLIKQIKNGQGDLVKEEAEIASASADQGSIIETVTSRVTDEMNESLLRPFSEAEVAKSLFQMHPLKAPGLDGLNALFYHRHWDIVKGEVTEFCLDVLNGGRSLEEVNFTNIALIPKVSNPIVMTAFRPISLCNVIYKIVAKTIANRLRNILPLIISESQSAFVPGQLISDNILVAYELLHSLKNRRHGSQGFCALKLYMSKAYDRVEWVFIEAMMVKLGFHPNWVSLIMRCVSSVSFSVLINGNSYGSFSPGRGLKQGDPLSHFLFLFFAEGLSALLVDAERRKLLNGVFASRNGPRVTHLFFADDSLLFCKANMQECDVLHSLLQGYERASGQKINFDKSGAFFSANTCESIRRSISARLGIRQMTNPDRYLGLPVMVGREKRRSFYHLKERVLARIRGWKEKFLSQAGKETLIKAVAQSIPTYAMSVFRLPNSFFEELMVALNKFWWRSNGGKGICWAKWQHLCHPNSKGGLGFRSMASFNLALLAKQGWRLLANENSLCFKLLKAKYFPNCDFMRASVGSNPSWSWRSLCEGREVLEKGLTWRVGNGQDISIWFDKWIPRPWNFGPITQINPHLGHLGVHHLINFRKGCWDEHFMRQILLPVDVEAILEIPLGDVRARDSRRWYFEPKGIYTVKSGYRVREEWNQFNKNDARSSSRTSMGIWNAIWGARIPPKIKTFVWRLCNDYVPTFENLKRRGIPVQHGCLLCGRDRESAFHLFILCPWVRQAYFKAGLPHSHNVHPGSSVMLWVDGLVHNMNTATFSRLLVFLWQLWNVRNNVLHRGIMCTHEAVGVQVDQLLHEFKAAQESNFHGAPLGSLSPIKWQVPPPRVIKINYDAALKDGKIGIGIIARDASGAHLASKVVCKKGPKLPYFAECLAAREAAAFAMKLQMVDIILEGDAMLVTAALISEGIDCSEAGLCISSTKVLLSSFQRVACCHVKRGANTAADSLAKHAMVCDSDMEWLGNCPSFISNFTLYNPHKTTNKKRLLKSGRPPLWHQSQQQHFSRAIHLHSLSINVIKIVSDIDLSKGPITSSLIQPNCADLLTVCLADGGESPPLDRGGGAGLYFGNAVGVEIGGIACFGDVGDVYLGKCGDLGLPKGGEEGAIIGSSGGGSDDTGVVGTGTDDDGEEKNGVRGGNLGLGNGGKARKLGITDLLHSVGLNRWAWEAQVHSMGVLDGLTWFGDLGSAIHMHGCRLFGGKRHRPAKQMVDANDSVGISERNRDSSQPTQTLLDDSYLISFGLNTTTNDKFGC